MPRRRELVDYPRVRRVDEHPRCSERRRAMSFHRKTAVGHLVGRNTRTGTCCFGGGRQQELGAQVTSKNGGPYTTRSRPHTTYGYSVGTVANHGRSRLRVGSAAFTGVMNVWLPHWWRPHAAPMTATHVVACDHVRRFSMWRLRTPYATNWFWGRLWWLELRSFSRCFHPDIGSVESTADRRNELRMSSGAESTADGTIRDRPKSDDHPSTTALLNDRTRMGPHTANHTQRRTAATTTQPAAASRFIIGKGMASELSRGRSSHGTTAWWSTIGWGARSNDARRVGARYLPVGRRWPGGLHAVSRRHGWSISAANTRHPWARCHGDLDDGDSDAVRKTADRILWNNTVVPTVAVVAAAAAAFAIPTTTVAAPLHRPLATVALSGSQATFALAINCRLENSCRIPRSDCTRYMTQQNEDEYTTPPPSQPATHSTNWVVETAWLTGCEDCTSPYTPVDGSTSNERWGKWRN